LVSVAHGVRGALSFPPSGNLRRRLPGRAGRTRASSRGKRALTNAGPPPLAHAYGVTYGIIISNVSEAGSIAMLGPAAACRHRRAQIPHVLLVAGAKVPRVGRFLEGPVSAWPNGRASEVKNRLGPRTSKLKMWTWQFCSRGRGRSLREVNEGGVPGSQKCRDSLQCRSTNPDLLRFSITYPWFVEETGRSPIPPTAGPEPPLAQRLPVHEPFESQNFSRVPGWLDPPGKIAAA